MSQVAIVIPTYKEADSIPLLVPELLQINTVSEVIIVDDESGEESERLKAWVDSMSHEKKLVLVRRFWPHGGLSGAVRHGASIASKGISGGVLVMDGDGQHRPEDAAAIIRQWLTPPWVIGGEKAADTLHCVSGSRFIAGASTPGLSPSRRMVSRVLNHFYTRRGLTDVMTGFFCVNKNVILDTRNDGFKILHDIAMKSGWPLHFSEVPITFEKRQGGESKATLKELWKLVT